MLRPKSESTFKDSSKLFKFLRLGALEIWPLLIILIGLVIELAHIATTIWSAFYYYLGDSLTMVLLRQSFAHKEPFLWIFSSQFNLFPEGPIYFISSLFMTTVRASLILNSIFNVAIFYILIRIIGGLIFPKKRLPVQFISVLATLVLISEMLLERVPAIDQNTIATLFLFNTYFYGIILSSLATIAIIIALVKKQSISINNNVFLYATALIITTLTSFSNPLFIIQFEIPFIIVLFVLKIFRLIDYKKAFYLFIATSGSIFGYFLRIPFNDFVGSTPTSHINIHNVHPAISLLIRSANNDFHSVTGTFELIIGLLIILLGLCFSVYYLLIKKSERKAVIHLQILLISLFGIISPLVCIIFVVFTGQLTTRYLLPIYTFPLLSLLWLVIFNYSKQFTKWLVIAFSLIFIGVAVAGILSLKSAKSLFTIPGPPGSSCLAESLNYKSANGVASYGTARALDVYGLFNERVLQINGGGNGLIYPWLANLGAFKNKSFTFIIIDKPTTIGSGWGSYNGTISNLGYPDYIKNCTPFWVFIYNPSNKGYRILNSEIQQNYNRIYKLRQSGSASDFFNNP